MLRDPKSSALVDNFAAQWLHARNLRNATPDKNDFPDFDDNLRQAFERELKLFVGSIIREDRNVLDLMTADHTFVNERLARHYGIPNVYGPQFRRVTLTDDARKGLLGKGAVLLVTSHADRTSPVVRGKWILDNLLGAPPPPPPAVVPPLDDSPAAATLTMRQRMEKHRENPVCASCHKVMDPIGLALENFDAIGRWRDLDGESPIDASGVLTDGTKVNGAVDLRQALLQRPEVLVGTMTEKLLTYALGRGLEAYDMPAVRAIVREASRDRLPVLGARQRGRDQHAVPDAAQGVADVRPQAAPVAADRAEGRGGGARAAVPRRHGAGAHRAGAHGRGGAQAAGVRLHPARRHPRPVDAGHGGRRLRVQADPEAARAVPPADDGGHQPAAARARLRHQPRRRAVVVAHRRAAEAHRGARLLARRHARPGGGAGDRPGDDAAVARARHRGLHRPDRRLLARLQLRLHEHAQLEERRPRRCRWRSTRGWCSSGCSAAAPRARRGMARMQAPTGASSTSWPATSSSSRRASARATGAARRVPRSRARDRAPGAAGRAAHRLADRRARSAGGRAGGVRGSRRA